MELDVQYNTEWTITQYTHDIIMMINVCIYTNTFLYLSRKVRRTMAFSRFQQLSWAQLNLAVYVYNRYLYGLV